ncbi:heavy metal transporter [Flavobacteriales bacterium 33_180_T64]|nr:heavy metal transporter [Flavobacteriales bacterium 33_180_T64]
MKHSTVITGVLAIAFIALTVTSCNGNKKADNNDDRHHSEVKSDDHSNMNHDNSDGHHDKYTHKGERAIDINAQKNVTTSPIIDAYIQIKNGLVATDEAATAKGGTVLLTAFSKFDMTTLKDDTHKEYMEIYESAKEQAEHIVKSAIDHQREHFETLSTDINDLITLLGTEKTLYQDFCPMANNNKGAYWLSEVEAIKNPYFGSKMMKCGSIKRQIN